MEMIAVTHNETSEGVEWPLDFIHSLREKNKEALIVVDAVSSFALSQTGLYKNRFCFFLGSKGIRTSRRVWAYGW